MPFVGDKTNRSTFDAWVPYHPHQNQKNNKYKTPPKVQGEYDLISYKGFEDILLSVVISIN